MKRILRNAAFSRSIPTTAWWPIHWKRIGTESCAALAAAQEAYEKAKAADASAVTDAERAELMALSTDFPRLWRDPRTQMKEKKRMLRLLIEDVTLTKGDALHVDIRFAGGATRSLDVPLPKSCVELRTTDAEVVKEIDRLIDTYTDGEIADVLNERGVRTVVTTPWTAARIGRLRTIYRLTDRRTRLLAQGLLTPEDVAARYGVVLSTVHLWRRRGLLRAHPIDDRGNYLYEIPPEDLPAKYAHKREYQAETVSSSTTYFTRCSMSSKPFRLAFARYKHAARSRNVLQSPGSADERAAFLQQDA